MNSEINTEENTDTENQIAEEKKRATAIKWLMSSFIKSDDEELMDAFDNQNKMPWRCDK